MNLRELRKTAGLTLRDLAAILETNHVFISEIELGKRPMPERLQLAWGEAIGLGLGCRAYGRPPERIDLADLTPDERERVARFVADLRAARDAA